MCKSAYIAASQSRALPTLHSQSTLTSWWKAGRQRYAGFAGQGFKITLQMAGSLMSDLRPVSVLRRQDRLACAWILI